MRTCGNIHLKLWPVGEKIVKARSETNKQTNKQAITKMQKRKKESFSQLAEETNSNRPRERLHGK